jgi:hypothetical protein
MFLDRMSVGADQMPNGFSLITVYTETLISNDILNKPLISVILRSEWSCQYRLISLCFIIRPGYEL